MWAGQWPVRYPTFYGYPGRYHRAYREVITSKGASDEHPDQGQRPGSARPGSHRQLGAFKLAGPGRLPPSLLADLQDQIRCDRVAFMDWDISHKRAGSCKGSQPQDRNDCDDLD